MYDKESIFSYIACQLVEVTDGNVVCERLVAALSLLIMKPLSLTTFTAHWVFLIHPSKFHRPQWPHLYHMCGISHREKV